MENISLSPLREFSRNYRNEILAFEQNIINNLQMELSLTKETSSLKIKYPIEQYTRRGNIIGDALLLDGENIVAVLEIKHRILPPRYLEHIKRELKKSVTFFDAYYGILICATTENSYSYYNYKVNSNEWEDEISLEIVLNYLSDYVSNIKKKDDCKVKDDISLLKNEITKCLGEQKLKNESDVQKVIDNIEKIQWGNERFSLEEKDENALFLALLGEVEREKTYCRYTSLQSFFRILKEKRITMSSIMVMNDSSEGFYAPSYVELKEEEYKGALDDAKNDCFILSCSSEDVAEELLNWNMYGDAARGVMYSVSVKDEVLTNSSFVMAKVSYAQNEKSHPELDFIKNLLSIKISDKGFNLKTFSIWKHFFKPYEYEKEKEVRLFYKHKIEDWEDDNKIDWICTDKNMIAPIISFPLLEFPLEIQSVVLGPKLFYQKENMYQLEKLIKNSNSSLIKHIAIKQSKIKNYR